MALITANQVADYFLSLVDEESGDTISNLKLQKLLYYAQGLHLALTGKPLFSDQIRAWEHGPVVPAIYRQYKQYGANAIPKPKGLGLTFLDSKTKEFLIDVWNVFGQFSAWKLRTMTHEEAPWKDTPPNGIISRDSMRSYFKRYIKA